MGAASCIVGCATIVALTSGQALGDGGQVILFLWTVAVLFHLANGIRYLFWDGPHIGFDPKTASAVSVFNYVFAVLASVAIWAVVLLA